jgi:hypothetical protein
VEESPLEAKVAGVSVDFVIITAVNRTAATQVTANLRRDKVFMFPLWCESKQVRAIYSLAERLSNHSDFGDKSQAPSFHFGTNAYLLLLA